MIVFDLKCTAGHVFEAWFGSSEDYEGQRVRGLVECALCGDRQIEKAVMAPAVSPKGNRAPAGGQVVAGGAGEQAKALMRALAAAQAEIERNADFVGDAFAEEARAIHFGETPGRGIYGQATEAEVKSLLDDGVPVAPMPFPVKRRLDG